MKNTWKWTAGALAVVGLLAACGGGDSASDGASFDLSGAPGSLLATPTALTTLPPAAFASVDALTGGAKCSVSFHYFQYGTVGGAGEKTTASGGIMVPTGTNPACTGPRPVLLYAHGTSTDKNKNMASPADGEAALVAAIYAAQGYIVVAPNYAGYEASTLAYHPYLNLQQQAQDVVDALRAARKGFAAVGANASPALFVAGYSQGGFVSMAAQRKLQLDGTPVTAGAHSSGPYALGTFGDAVYAGNVNLGATFFTPLLNTSFQRAYGNIYNTPGEMYETTYLSGIESLLPGQLSQTALLTSGKLPATALFAPASEDEIGRFGFGTPNLIRADYRAAVLADLGNPTPAHPLRVAAYANDLLNKEWSPNRPMLLCGGNADPTVFFALNTGAAQTYFGARMPAGTLAVLDVDSSPTGPSDPFAAAKVGFSTTKAGVTGGDVAVTQAYHGTLVPPFCNAASKGFFDNILALSAAPAPM
jgi:acetyl esterase/lipase